MNLAYIAALPLILFLIAFFYAPLAVLAYYSVIEEGGEIGPGNYIEVFQDPAYLRVILYSTMIAAQTTIATLILSLPAAYYISRHSKGPEKIILLVAMITPFWIDFLLRALAIRNIMYLLDMREGYTTMIIGMIYDYLPYMFLPIYASIATLRENIIQAAKTLGASNIQITIKIILPLILPGITVGSILVFLMSMTEYVIPSLLGGTQGFTIGTLIYYLFLSGDKWGQGSALTLLITITLLIATTIITRNKVTQK